MSFITSADRLFCAFLEEQPPISGLLVALSGGADSVVLLHLAHRYAQERGYRVEALHVHHGIRGEEADRDQAFCQTLCESLHIPLGIRTFHIPALAKAEGKGIEETARRYRYLALEEYARERELDHIATAHTATDNLETVLLQLTRGSAGLVGIPSVRGIYLRPLLCATREDILDYLQAWKLPHVEDSSNESDLYSRNLIRHRVLPILRELNPRAEDAFGRAVAYAREDSAYLDSLASSAAQSGRVNDINSLPPPLRRRALMARCKALGLGEITSVHLQALEKLVNAAIPHSSLSLPKGEVAIEEGLLTLSRKTEEMPWEVCLHRGENHLPDGSILYLARPDEKETEKYISSKQNIYKLLTNVTIKFATIEGALYARSRRPGDRILIGGMHRKVKKLYCDNALPLTKRNASPIICQGEEILWIPAIHKIRDQVSDVGTSPLTLIWLQKGTDYEDENV